VPKMIIPFAFLVRMIIWTGLNKKMLALIKRNQHFHTHFGAEGGSRTHTPEGTRF